MRVETVGTGPDPLTAFRALDRHAAAAARQAGRDAVAVVQPMIPRRTGQAAAQTKARVKKVPEGYLITVGPSKRVAWRVKFFEVGTGIYGPRHRPIRPRRAKAFRLPGGIEVAQVKGQRAQHTFRRARPRMDAAVQAAFRAAATGMVR